MAATVNNELAGNQSASLSGTVATAKAEYWVENADGPIDAVTASGLPDIGDGHPEDALLKLVSKEADEEGGTDTQYKVTCNYEVKETSKGGGQPENPQNGDEWWSFNFQGQSIHAEIALDQEPFGAKPPKTGLTVGLQQDDSITGYDKIVPAGSLSVKKWQTTLSGTDIRNIYLAQGRINSTTFYGFQAGELLYIGASFAKPSTGGLYEIVHNFAIETNAEASDLPTFTNPDGTTFTITSGKKGHEYLWDQTTYTKNGTTKQKDVASAGAYVAQVYNTSTFSNLNLSGSL